MSDERWVWGVGLATTAADGTVLDTWYPSPEMGRIPLGFDPAMAPDDLDRLAVPDQRRAVTVDVVTVEIDLDAAPKSTSDAYLRLHALSHRLVRPNEVNLHGIFGAPAHRGMDERRADASRRRDGAPARSSRATASRSRVSTSSRGCWTT